MALWLRCKVVMGRGVRILGGDGDSEPVVTLAFPSKVVDNLIKDDVRRSVDACDVLTRGRAALVLESRVVTNWGLTGSSWMMGEGLWRADARPAGGPIEACDFTEGRDAGSSCQSRPIGAERSTYTGLKNLA